tara:strand:+ start:17103 stop:17429 length:327 start_codon:yes stop_codon:yes gene_type:complete
MLLLDEASLSDLLRTYPRWRLVDDAKAIAADFKFPDFAVAWGFMNEVAVHAERLDHHPEWSNVYNRVSIRLTTHDAGESGSLTNLDELMLRVIERASKGSMLGVEQSA